MDLKKMEKITQANLRVESTKTAEKCAQQLKSYGLPKQSDTIGFINHLFGALKNVNKETERKIIEMILADCTTARKNAERYFEEL